MNLLFATRPLGFHRDRGWAAWLGRLGGPHLSLWRAKAYDRFRSFIQVRAGLPGLSAILTLVKYREGGSIPWHTDSDTPFHLGVVWVLKPSEEGGEFEWRGQPPHYQSDRLIVFDGNRSEHRVARINKGTRWIVMFQIAQGKREPLHSTSHRQTQDSPHSAGA